MDSPSLYSPPEASKPLFDQSASLLNRAIAAALDAMAFFSIGTFVWAIWLFGALPLVAKSSICDENLTLVCGLLSFGGSLLSLITPLFVFASMEASRLQATPGKIAMGLRVVDASSRPMTLGRSLIKQFTQAFVHSAAYVPSFIVIAVSALIYGPQVMNEVFLAADFLIIYPLYFAFLCIGFGATRQTTIDRLCQRYVLVDGRDPSSLSLTASSALPTVTGDRHFE